MKPEFIFRNSLLDMFMSQEVTKDHLAIVGVVTVVIYVITLLGMAISYGADGDQRVFIGFVIAMFATILMGCLMAFNIFIVLGAVAVIVGLGGLESIWWRVERKVNKWRNGRKVAIN